jgi:protein gp37
MSTSTKISWTDATWNPIVGCSKVSPGCANCYAETMAGRLAAMGQRAYQDVVEATPCGPGYTYGPNSGWNGNTQLVESALTQPLHWKKPRRIFVCSMSDLFHPATPFEWIDKVFAVMALCPQHTFQVLTKRPERMAEYLTASHKVTEWCDCGLCGDSPLEAFQLPLPNVHLGTTVENQQAADERIPHLLRCPAAVRFLSCEPLLGGINLRPYFAHSIMCEKCPPPGTNGGEPCACPRIHWVIAGGESGAKARPMHPSWLRSLRDQCKAAGVPFHFKQWGEWAAYEYMRARQMLTDGRTYPVWPNHGKDAGLMARVGKKAAGRLLDGVEHNEFPKGGGK